MNEKESKSIYSLVIVIGTPFKFIDKDKFNVVYCLTIIIRIISIDMSWLVVGEELGIPNHAVPFLDPNATGKSILYGVNYASGGGGILNATGRIFVWIFL